MNNTVQLSKTVQREYTDILQLTVRPRSGKSRCTESLKERWRVSVSVDSRRLFVATGAIHGAETVSLEDKRWLEGSQRAPVWV